MSDGEDSKPLETDENETIPQIAKDLDESRFDREFPYIPLTAMNPAPYNPRVISAEAMTALSHSLESYGLVQPLVWNKRSGNLVGGHQRFKLLQQQGVKEVKTCVVDLDETEEQMLNISLNNPALQGEFSAKALRSVIDSIKKKKSKKEMVESGLVTLETQIPLFEEDVRNATRPVPTEIPEEPVDLSYIVPSLRGLAIPINSLKPDKGNVRIHSDRNRLAVRESISKFGQMRPIVAYKNTVMAGNCTWEEMKGLGYKHVAAVRIDHLTPAEMVAFGIVDNKSAELAGNDFKKLADTFRNMDDELLLFTGFAPYEIQPLLAAEWKPPAPTEGEQADAINNPEAPQTHRSFTLPIAVANLLGATVLTICNNLAEGIQIICEHYVSCDAVVRTPSTRRADETSDATEPETEPVA
jgi:ParB-like chromosome segregation protein Spo0J